MFCKKTTSYYIFQAISDVLIQLFRIAHLTSYKRLEFVFWINQPLQFSSKRKYTILVKATAWIGSEIRVYIWIAQWHFGPDYYGLRRKVNSITEKHHSTIIVRKPRRSYVNNVHHFCPTTIISNNYIYIYALHNLLSHNEDDIFE